MTDACRRSKLDSRGAGPCTEGHHGKALKPRACAPCIGERKLMDCDTRCFCLIREKAQQLMECFPRCKRAIFTTYSWILMSKPRHRANQTPKRRWPRCHQRSSKSSRKVRHGTGWIIKCSSWPSVFSFRAVWSLGQVKANLSYSGKNSPFRPASLATNFLSVDECEITQISEHFSWTNVSARKIPPISRCLCYIVNLWDELYQSYTINDIIHNRSEKFYM